MISQDKKQNMGGDILYPYILEFIPNSQFSPGLSTISSLISNIISRRLGQTAEMEESEREEWKTKIIQ